MIRLAAGGATDPGRVRADNQDAYVIAEDLFAVCDGVGGHRGGEVASRTAVDALERAFHIRTLTGAITAVLEANKKVWEAAQADSALRGMASTLTAVVRIEEEDGDGSNVAVLNVGDSRTYLLRDGELTQLSEDHSLVEELVRDGRLTRAEADVHPQRSLITRALGLEREVDVDAWPVIAYDGDRYLLCSDGLTGEVSEDRIAATLRRLADPEEASRELVRLARDAGGHDNITALIVDVTEEADPVEVDDLDQLVATDAEPESDAASELGVTDDPTGGPLLPERNGEPERAAEPRGRRLTWRVGAFAVALLLVLGVAGGAVSWYARSTYYVGVDDGQVTIFRGRPGGLLWFDPTMHLRTSLAATDVPPVNRPDIEAGKEFASKGAAERYVANLQDQIATTTTTTTASSTTTPTATTTPPSTAP